jgi:hypothetical protein
VGRELERNRGNQPMSIYYQKYLEQHIKMPLALVGVKVGNGRYRVFEEDAELVGGKLNRTPKRIDRYRSVDMSTAELISILSQDDLTGVMVLVNGGINEDT